jgi:hypothetical protein
MSDESELDWINPDFYINAYRSYIEKRWNTEMFPGIESIDLRIASLGIPKSTSYLDLGMGSHLISGSYSTLLNDTNGFLDDLYAISIWNSILNDYADLTQRVHLIVEFVEHRARAALNAPRALKDNLIFAAAKIGIFLERGAKGKIPEDHRIKVGHLNGWIGDWDGFERLDILLKEIDNEQYREKTKNFRNRMHHNTPVGIGIGIIPDYRFENEGAGLRFTFGHTEPLSLTEIIDSCLPQYSAFKNALWHYRSMLLTQLKLRYPKHEFPE